MCTKKSEQPTFARVIIYGLIEIVGNGGSIWGSNVMSSSIHQGTMQKGNNALKNGLHMPAEPPKTRRRVSEKAGKNDAWSFLKAWTEVTYGSFRIGDSFRICSWNFAFEQ